jgi:hypothetical protein
MATKKEANPQKKAKPRGVLFVPPLQGKAIACPDCHEESMLAGKDHRIRNGVVVEMFCFACRTVWGCVIIEDPPKSKVKIEWVPLTINPLLKELGWEIEEPAVQ